jgi:L-galactono-1,4-lactone dehydrogenase
LTSGLMAAAFYQNCGSNKLSTTLLEKEDATITSTTTILNWSGTHAVDVSNDRYWEPESVQDVERIVKYCHELGQPVRPLGSALSPNGIAFHPGGMISMENLDQILSVDTEQRTVTVQAGARVSQVVDALRKYHLTLPNLASIAEQQMGGFVQVGAHGTGKYIAPVDEYVTSMKLVTPGKGTVVLTKEENGEIFQLAKVGLGCLGVVVEITMECVPAHNLVEHTFVLARKQAKEQLDELLERHKHMRYMWIPYTDAVVCVTNDPEETIEPELRKNISSANTMSPDERFRPLVELLIELTQDTSEPYTEQTVRGMGFGELRDALLAVNPLDVQHVRRCNAAEADFWKRSEGYQIRPSDELLQFDCGGQQWVWELCFSTGTQERNNGNDMFVMEELLKGIEERNIPAHSPIEQRWTASSSSLMSPAHGPPNGLHSWVGIINYLPSENELQRREITHLFTETYCDLFRQVGDKVGAASHWAKLERPSSFWKLVDLRIALQNKFPVQSFNALRAIYDPKNILASPLINLTLGEPNVESNKQH